MPDEVKGPLTVADVIRSSREATGVATITREMVDSGLLSTETTAEIADKPADEPTDGEKAKPKIQFKSAYVANDGVIYLIGAYAGNIDLDDDVLQTKALVDMSYDFTAAAVRTFKCNHKDELGADLVASMPGAPILKSGKTMSYGEDVPENDPIVGISLTAEPIAWFVGIRPHDQAVVEKAKAGEIVGASWGAFVDRTEITE